MIQKEIDEIRSELSSVRETIEDLTAEAILLHSVIASFSEGLLRAGVPVRTVHNAFEKAIEHAVVVPKHLWCTLPPQTIEIVNDLREMLRDEGSY